MCSYFKRRNWGLLNKGSIFRQHLSINDNSSYDVAIVGGGIVGSAVAREILHRKSNLKCAVIEKENALGMHQSRLNSGVIHAGIYYKPGSMMAKLCAEGMDLLYDYLEDKHIPYKKVGKLIVATTNEEVKGLEALYTRGKENNVKDLRMISANEISSIEPHCVGVKAIHSPHTGIVDYGVVTKQYGQDFLNLGGDIHYNFEVKSIRTSSESENEISDITKFPIEIISKQSKIVRAGFVLTCAGLHADRVAMLNGGFEAPAIVPIRGEYLLLNPHKQYLVKGNVYPVPDPSLPFLGVHFTPKLDGSVWVGPNAVLALKREGYKAFDVSVQDLWDLLKYQGFRKMASKYFLYGVKEHMKYIYLRAQVAELKRYVPELSIKDISRGPCGVRAQAVSKEGCLIHDFTLETGSNKRILHCRNAPSPAATSSLAIARVLAEEVLGIMKKF